MVSKSLSYWDIKLSHAEFAYNMSSSYAISHSPFEVDMVVTLSLFLTLFPFLTNLE